MKFFKRILIVFAVVIVIAGGNMLFEFGSYKRAVESMNFSNIDISSIPDGTYEGDCDVSFVYAKVKVNVEDGKITGIELLEHKNGKGEAAERLIDDILEKQTTNVDVVSGATSSSKVIRKAVENALANK